MLIGSRRIHAPHFLDSFVRGPWDRRVASCFCVPQRVSSARNAPPNTCSVRRPGENVIFRYHRLPLSTPLQKCLSPLSLAVNTVAARFAQDAPLCVLPYPDAACHPFSASQSGCHVRYDDSAYFRDFSNLAPGQTMHDERHDPAAAAAASIGICLAGT